MKSPCTQILSAIAPLCLIAAMASPGHAQTRTSASSNLYQVEVIVFERTGGADEEHWPKNLDLSYPERWQRLIDPEAEAVRQAEREAQARTEAALSRLPEDFLQTLRQENPGFASTETGTRPTSEPTDPAAQAPAQPSSPASSLPATAHYEYLDAKHHNLTQARNAIHRSNRSRVLLHQAWVQPLTGTEAAPALILHGGRSFGEHYELQGYLTPSLGRYLHIQANLWLTHFVPRDDPASEHWPDLPRVPDARSSTEQAQRLAHEMTAGADTDSRPLGTAFQNTHSLFADRTTLTLNDRSAHNPDAEALFPSLLAAPYKIHRTVTLQQRRRMRSGELHYLDHPRLGLLIQITPYRP